MKTSTLRKYFVFIWPLWAGLSSCNLINPAEQIPAYLQIDSVLLTTVPGQGTASNKITDVWIDANNAQQGVYEIPKTFPVLDNGSTALVVNAGIMDNGISATRVVYPFYYPDTMTIDLTEKKIYSLYPHFVYRSSTVFSFIEDFEAGNLFEKLSGDTNMIRITGPEVFEGVYSAYIFLDSTHNLYEGRTSNTYSLESGSPAYIELNYKCDQAFEVGLYGISQALGNIFDYKWKINKKDSWNKIYLNVGTDVQQIKAESYQILIRAVYDTTNVGSHIYLDNVKLVNF